MKKPTRRKATSKTYVHLSESPVEEVVDQQPESRLVKATRELEAVKADVIKATPMVEYCLKAARNAQTELDALNLRLHQLRTEIDGILDGSLPS